MTDTTETTTGGGGDVKVGISAAIGAANCVLRLYLFLEYALSLVSDI